jgi:hypothetical protein
MPAGAGEGLGVGVECRGFVTSLGMVGGTMGEVKGRRAVVFVGVEKILIPT